MLLRRPDDARTVMMKRVSLRVVKKPLRTRSEKWRVELWRGAERTWWANRRGLVAM